jgi:hypothetical protein
MLRLLFLRQPNKPHPGVQQRSLIMLNPLWNLAPFSRWMDDPLLKSWKPYHVFVTRSRTPYSSSWWLRWLSDSRIGP